MKSEVTSNIGDIRAIEDCIRASKKYTEGLGTLDRHHPVRAQGGEFPSVVFCKNYEVYPDVAEVSWDMPVGQALDWLSEARCVNFRFYYDYRNNTATVSLPSLDDELWEKLKAAVPGFSAAFKKARIGSGVQYVKPLPEIQEELRDRIA